MLCHYTYFVKRLISQSFLHEYQSQV